MRRLRIEVSMLVVISVFWTGTPAFAGPGRKVGPPLTPPGRAVGVPWESRGAPCRACGHGSRASHRTAAEGQAEGAHQATPPCRGCAHQMAVDSRAKAQPAMIADMGLARGTSLANGVSRIELMVVDEAHSTLSLV